MTAAKAAQTRTLTLTPQELAIMKVVWRRDAATVRDVYEALRESRRIAYTTVMTMMNILESKGYLKKEKDERERAYRYRPARPERTVITSMVREFVNRVFDGASQPLLLHLVKDGRLSDKERDELLRLIKEAE
jgi:BlaI family transcriptional regulator, penicillinase repressor